MEVRYPLAFCEAISVVRNEATNKLFRVVFLSGVLVVKDQNASLWSDGGPRKAKVMLAAMHLVGDFILYQPFQGVAETRPLAFSDEQKQNGQNCETYVVRPCGVLHKKKKGIITARCLNKFVIGVAELAAAMIEIGLKRDSKDRIIHAALLEKGKAVLQKAR
ncbi:uncharacterized protein A1O5_05183 [Cladophialophora psammophila CBS 110553]|uniref:Uncharacterized protein n=1 Tax=Cladophialophora psammophila CBS 110553 TaxID=1182543 RepID=W9X389_9EURO|nr:uncharacterized protein A1O5_05183 [Cladophialophora psammophila CBS 110553]EXJ71376.1 hypothetical protein A1O5_05183 [Cladophialophora psammophila CBS 110553]